MPELPTLPAYSAPFYSFTRVLFLPVAEPSPDSLSLSPCFLAPVWVAIISELETRITAWLLIFSIFGFISCDLENCSSPLR